MLFQATPCRLGDRPTFRRMAFQAVRDVSTIVVRMAWDLKVRRAPNL